MLKGIDVSTLQGTIDWSRVSADFAMIKATQGHGNDVATGLYNEVMALPTEPRTGVNKGTEENKCD